MKNKILKIILVLGVLFVFVVGGIFAFIIYSLPSSKSLSKAFSSKSNKTEIQSQTAGVASLDYTLKNSDKSEKINSSDVSSADQTTSAGFKKKSLDYLMDPNIPLSDFCQSLKNAKSGVMKAAEFNSEFQKSTTDDNWSDTRVAAMLPLFRTIFREPKMKDLILEVKSAVENKEENFWQKAAFYSRAALAFQAMVNNKPELEAVSDRSYLFLKMNDLISKKPELLNNEILQKFCADTESAFNTNQPVLFEQEKKSFERILQELGVNPEEIKYDPNYKTKFVIDFDGKSLQLNGGWLEDLIQSEKPAAQK